MKPWRIVAACCLAQGLALACLSVVAKDTSPGNVSVNALAHFEPRSTDGEAFSRPAGCGSNSKTVDAFQRDLGQGVTIYVIPTYDDEKLLSTNLIFRYYGQGALRIQPEKFELHDLTAQKIFHPARLYRSQAVEDGEETFYEEVYLEFPIAPESARHMAVAFPDGTLDGKFEVLRVKSVLFDWIGQSAGAKAKLARCLYTADPPARLEVSQLQSLHALAPAPMPHPPPRKTLNLRRMYGAWVVDGKASAEYFRKFPPPSMDGFLSVAEGLFSYVYEFGDEIVFVSTAPGGKKTPYQFASEQAGGNFIYKSAILKDAYGDFLVISATGDDSIRIQSSRNDLTRHFLYKRVEWDPKIANKNWIAAKDAFRDFGNALSAESAGKSTNERRRD